MKLTYLPLVSLLLTVGCGNSIQDMLNMGKRPYTKHKTDPAFAQYVEAFNLEFQVTSKVPIIFNKLDSNRAGVCYVWSDGYREVQIDSTYWANFSEEQKEQLVFHELGHCVFNLNHDDSKMQNNQSCPNSIMRSFMFNQFEINNCYIPERLHYMEDIDGKR